MDEGRRADPKGVRDEYADLDELRTQVESERRLVARESAKLDNMRGAREVHRATATEDLMLDQSLMLKSAQST